MEADVQEWCSCGASFRTRSYPRLLVWRDTHPHQPHVEPEPEPQGTQSFIERSFQEDDNETRIGFMANPQYSDNAKRLASELRAKALRNLGRSESEHRSTPLLHPTLRSAEVDQANHAQAGSPRHRRADRVRR